MANSIIFGVNEANLNLNGKTAAEATKLCVDLLGVPEDSILKVDGYEVESNYIIEDGEDLEFVKNSGVKGSDILVIVQKGVNRVEISVNDGSTVGEVLKYAQARLGLPDMDGEILCNGKPVSASDYVTYGDMIEARKNAGGKGC